MLFETVFIFKLIKGEGRTGWGRERVIANSFCFKISMIIITFDFGVDKEHSSRAKEGVYILYIQYR